MTAYNGNPVPPEGQTIAYVDGRLVIPDTPVIPYIEGDGTGRDIWRASRRVFDAAVAKTFGGQRRIVWYEVFAGGKAFKEFG
ncbi:MAG: NADP-dependent isocitrate dehydrogenase, partial [Acidobacteriia bacterium]|nr:NADP-dependent isocitrate dehydrogenase [Terriglobia bacterium]